MVSMSALNEGEVQVRRWRTNRLLRRACRASVLIATLTNLEAQSPPATPAPIAALSANGRAETQTYQGWPLILNATLLNPARFAATASVAPLMIDPQQGSWANTIQLVATDSNAATQNWPVHMIAVPSGSLSLDAFNSGRVVWVIAPSDTSMIAPGTYRVSAVLDTTKSATAAGWNGIAYSDPAIVTIGLPPTASTLAQQTEQARLLALYDHLLGNDSQAVADISALLEQQPGNIEALAVEGNLLEQMGQTTQAASVYTQAIAAFLAANAGPSSADPPDVLLVAQNRVRATLLSQSAGRGQPQPAIQLLDVGSPSAGVFFVDLQISNVGSDVAQTVILNQLTFQTTSGSGQVTFNSALSPHFPMATDFLAVNDSAAVRFFVSVQGAVNSFLLTEKGTAADVFGTPTGFTQTQTVSLDAAAGSVALSITASNIAQQYGTPIGALNNVIYTGFVNGDTASSLSGTLTCTTTATQASPVGTYPITCSGLSSPNYKITFLPGTLTITSAPLTVTATGTSRQYGQSNPTFSVAYNGFANGDSPSSLSGTLTCMTAAAAGSPVGAYTIACSGLSSTNYAITYMPGQLMVTPAPLTITANNASRLSSQANPAFSTSYAGFVNGDTPSALSGTLVCTTTATPSSAAGTYPINCSGLTSANYGITYLPGQLTVIGCAANATSSVSVTRSGFSYSPLFKLYAQTLTLTNISAADLTAPLYVVVDSLSANATLANAAGKTQCVAPLGNSYVSVNGTLRAGSSATVVIKFADPSNTSITYTIRMLAGSGQP